MKDSGDPLRESLRAPKTSRLSPKSAACAWSRSEHLRHERRETAVARERIGEAAVRLSYNVGARMLGILGLKELVRRHALPRIVGVLQSAETPGSFAAADRYIEDEIERVVRKPGPIIVGPFPVGGWLRAALLDSAAPLDQG